MFSEITSITRKGSIITKGRFEGLIFQIKLENGVKENVFIAVYDDYYNKLSDEELFVIVKQAYIKRFFDS